MRAAQGCLGGVGAGWILLALLAAGAAPVEAQVTWRDFVLTGGLSSEGYQGNLEAAAVAVRDSSELASAVVGEFGVRGDLTAGLGDGRRARLTFDGGVRQYSARGFESRDYAPREWSGTVDASLMQALGSMAQAEGWLRVRGRQVEDRPPMPLFLQAGYRSVAAGVRGEVSEANRRWDLEARGEWVDFLAPAFAPQVRILDRRAAGLEVGVRPGWDEARALRFHAGATLSHHPEQMTFLADDPFRRDRTFQGGVSWSWQGDMLAQVAGEVRANRSNSRRPEYDAATVRALASIAVAGDVSLTGYLALTAKRYRFPTDAARLIPGEEANSASQAYLALSRGLARNLDGSVRLGWARAESEIGGRYFQRFGGTMLLHYRPGLQ